MDVLSRSYRLKSRRDKGKFSRPVYPLSRPAFSRVIRNESAAKWLREHPYVSSSLVWLYAHNLRLSPPNLLWLKGVDRKLFSPLHSANTTKGFIEGVGIVAVARTEAEVIRLILPRPENHPAAKRSQEESRGKRSPPSWRLANSQKAHNLMKEYDMDRRGREKSLWEEALEVIKTTTMAELTLRYITLNKPETDETAAPEAMIPTDAILRNISLPEIAARTSLKQPLFEPSWAPPQLSGRIFLVDKKRPLARPFFFNYLMPASALPSVLFGLPVLATREV
uniref:Conjugal transfer protein TrbA n=1 Tax=Leclercia adecarboxylata TaxID=83655 RepID=A0A2Z2DXB6_9ENTR|nr:Conjugal transfer protein TrbA [Leclercia adecarboxylata]